MYFWAGAGVLVFVLDEALKQTVEKMISPGEERGLAGGKVLVRKVYNKGAAFNILEDHPSIVKRASLAIGTGALFYDTLLLAKSRRPIRKLGMMLLTGGAFSNIFDRLVRGKVIDYIGFRTRWPKLTQVTYNIGDFAIFAGVCLTLLSKGKRTLLPDRE